MIKTVYEILKQGFRFVFRAGKKRPSKTRRALEEHRRRRGGAAGR
jgi:hypothetical protein